MKTGNELLFQKVAEYVKTTASEVEKLNAEISQLKEKRASDDDFYEAAIRKAAQALYESDFISEMTERAVFIKKAKESPAYLASVIEKVCNAADVSLIGKPARVTSRKQAEFDPVAARAFGWDSSSVLEDS